MAEREAVEEAVYEGTAGEIGGASERGPTRVLVGEGSVLGAEERTAADSPPHLGSVDDDLPSLTERSFGAQGRDERGYDLDREVEERVRAHLARLAPLEDELREARIRLERDRELMGAVASAPAQGGASATAPTRVAPAGAKTIAPREYSPKGGVGPGKWLFHLEMYFTCSYVTGEDRVHQGAMLLRDAAEAWWRAHVLETTTPEGTAAAGRIVTWEAFKE